MAKKKKKKIPFHIAHNMKEYSYEDGGLTITFWAKDDIDAELYRKKVEVKNVWIYGRMFVNLYSSKIKWYT